MAKSSFSSVDFLLRWLFAIVLVVGTWNPTGYSWAHWFWQAPDKTNSLLLLAGVVLLIAWVIYLNTTVKALGTLGVILGVALLAAVLWVCVDYGLLSLSDSSVLSWVGLVMLATLLGVGISWSHISRRLTGQVDVDELPE